MYEAAGVTLRQLPSPFKFYVLSETLQLGLHLVQLLVQQITLSSGPASGDCKS